ncbi:MAG TPA: primosomal protein N', partial [Desulfobacterales bacterium]|nr:primosomal protein N' [Desulfobacterales bacterium]
MSFEKPYIRVAVALPVSRTFTYEVPEPLRSWAMVGKRVLVPFKNFQVTGYILELLSITHQTGVKKILDVLDETPMFPASMIPFFSWIATYYCYPIGEVIKGALPGGLNITHVETVSITDKGRSMLSGPSLNGPDRMVLEALQERGPVRLRTLYKDFKEKFFPQTLRRLERARWIVRERKLKPGRVRPKMERYVKAVEKRPSAEPLSQVRRRILKIVEDHGEMPLTALKGEVSTAGALVKKMADDGFLILFERGVYRDPLGERILPDGGPPDLTGDQSSVVERLSNTLGKGFQTYLLYGITASGKTEVYMRAVAATLERNREALVLVPEIALISQ